MDGALALSNAAPYFPPGTIHVAVVDPGVGGERKPLLVEWNGCFLIGPDNGLLSLAFPGSKPDALYHLTERSKFLESISSTFHGRDIFAPVAGRISLGVKPHEFGNRLDQWVELDLPRPGEQDGRLEGEVIHVDRFGNLISNIRSQDLERYAETSMLDISVAEAVISGIRKSYAEVPEGKLLAVIGSRGYLEISENRGSAAKRLSAGRGTPVVITRAPANREKEV
jgi:S-adenosylmethionine hydrolase